MTEQNDSTEPAYPHGRGYGHDYMRGGEVFGGYGYSARDEYERSRGELNGGRARTLLDDGGAPGDLTARAPL